MKPDRHPDLEHPEPPRTPTMFGPLLIVARDMLLEALNASPGAFIGIGPLIILQDRPLDASRQWAAVITADNIETLFNIAGAEDRPAIQCIGAHLGQEVALYTGTVLNE